MGARMTANSNDLGKILKQRRDMVPLSLSELARASGVSTSHLARMERGERFPSATILRKIARPLGFSEAELFMHAGFLPSETSTEESETQFRRLEPHVARVLSQEPVEVQRAVISILSILKTIAKV